jgi:hypothetical protein
MLYDAEEIDNSPRELSMDFVSQEHGVPRDGPKGFERRGLNV